MEQDVDNNYRTACSTCLSSDRNLYSLNGSEQVYQVFSLLMNDFAGDREFILSDPNLEIPQLICWECFAVMKRIIRFKAQVHSAQEHLRIIALSRAQEAVDHTYMSQSLSALEVTTKAEYDKIYFDYAQEDWHQYIAVPSDSSQSVKNEHYDVAQVVRDNIDLEINNEILEVPEIVLEDPVTGVMSHIVVGTDALVAGDAFRVKGDMDIVPIGEMNHPLPQIEIMCQKKTDAKLSYITEYMSQAEMLCMREEAKQKIQYASSVYKCELCVIGFYTQQQVEDHFVSDHRAKLGRTACKVCYVYIDDASLNAHTEEHYLRHVCKLCGHSECSTKLITLHVASHMNKHASSAIVKIEGSGNVKSKKKKSEAAPPKPSELRKLLSKTTIEGYQCLECDMFFKNSRARKNHVARFHREGLQCDHCKKRFVNRTTLTTHLKLHEGPLPRKECPICHKMVRVIQLKYHVLRHEIILHEGPLPRKECPICHKMVRVIQLKYHVLRHEIILHEGPLPRKECPNCHKMVRVIQLKYHVLRHEIILHEGPLPRKECPICHKMVRVIQLKYHVLRHEIILHEGPLPRKECPICHKMVRVIQLKYHVLRHEKKGRFECVECNKIFSHLATYQAHLKYSRAHANDDIFKFPCPMCNKGYPTKEAMQDHFNYQHLGKTSHKCPICDKPIASRANVEKHMMRVHGKKKEKPRNHVCPTCRKGFTDKKALNQHLVIHSGERPLTCDVCQQTFKHKASLYTHKKRVHKVYPAKRVLEYMETKPG